MKLEEIKRETSNMVREHLANGWILDWNDFSWGCQTCEVLIKGDKVRFIYASWERTDHSDCMNPAENAFRVGIAEVDIQDRNCCGPWEKKEYVIFEKIYYRLGDKCGKEDWYTDNREEAQGAARKRAERYRRTRESVEPKVLVPSDRLVEILRNQTPLFYDKATKKNVRVMKVTRKTVWGRGRVGYHVALLNRLGNMKAEIFYPLSSKA